jgi:hypothetical protein
MPATGTMPSAVAIDRPSEPVAVDDGRAAFANWLICWLLLPNLPFLPITVAGGPARYPEILLCGGVGLIARRLNYPAQLILFVALIAYLVLVFIGHMFNMAISMIVSVAGLVMDINPLVSPEYLVGASLLLTTCGLAFWRLAKPTDFTGLRWVAAALCITSVLAAADYGRSRENATAYSRLPAADSPFTSATAQTDLLGLADGRHNLMVVVVEAMGQPTNPVLRARLDAIWTRPEFASRFEITRGTTTYYSSTTTGELRELCQRWGDYREIEGPQPDCLPALLARRGYQSRAYHAFVPTFFERDRWYPLIGFEQLSFMDDLERRGARHCPSVFPGACDRDVPALIADDVAQANGPQFIYWLTLNSHLPVVANRELQTDTCRQLGSALDDHFPLVCRLFSIWDGSAEALARMVARPDFPPTHILVVGDHMPPFTQQNSRLLFDPENVPWFLLRYRGSPSRDER